MRLSSLVILVIDADREHAEVLWDHLQRDGFVGVFVEREDTAFRKLSEGLCPDIILVNLWLLNMTLRTFSESLRRLGGEKISLIAMVGDPEQGKVARKFFGSCLVRPVSYESLSDAIRVVSRNLSEAESRMSGTTTPLDSGHQTTIALVFLEDLEIAVRVKDC